MGLQAPSGSRNLEIKPYALTGVSTDNTVIPPTSNDGTGRVGVDLKYGVTQNLTADVTINTDFAQVEVDEQQVNLTRFNLFFPEKRDFFLENLGIFAFAGRASAGLAAGSGDTPYLFFSRRIGFDLGRETPLRAGGRLTGKAGGFTLGLLNVQTGDEEAIAVEGANFTVLRAKRDILRRSSIGAMMTHRSSTPGRVDANDGFGVDASFGFYQSVHALVEAKARVHAEPVVGVDSSRRGRAMGHHRADAAPAQDVALGAKHGEVGSFDRDGLFVAGLHVEEAEREAAGLACQAAARAQRRFASEVEPDAAAEEQIRRVARSRPPARRWHVRRKRRCRGSPERTHASPERTD